MKISKVIARAGLPVFIVYSLLASAVFGGAHSPLVIPVWPGDAPGSEGKPKEEKTRIAPAGDHVVSGVHQPSLTVYLPSPEKATGAAVVICPGGGHRELWMDHEGYNLAPWLAERGIAAVILKYRLAREEGSTYSVEGHALPDAQRAIRLVRGRAAEWHIDPARMASWVFPPAEKSRPSPAASSSTAPQMRPTPSTE